jgi:hypothetical protein
MSNWNQIKQYMTECPCGRRTSKQYARKHDGKCKFCVTGINPAPRNDREAEGERNIRLIESGYNAYVREEGW